MNRCRRRKQKARRRQERQRAWKRIGGAAPILVRWHALAFLRQRDGCVEVRTLSPPLRTAAFNESTLVSAFGARALEIAKVAGASHEFIARTHAASHDLIAYPRAPQRRSTGLDGLDHVLGGGLMSRATVLLSARPGDGSRSFLRYIAARLAAQGHTLLYVTDTDAGKVAQCALFRGLANAHIIAERSVPALLATLRRTQPSAVCVESLHGFGIPEVEAAQRLVDAAQSAELTLIAASMASDLRPVHIAHMMDVNLQLTRDAGRCVLRAVKNRFGPCGRTASFEREGDGFRAALATA